MRVCTIFFLSCSRDTTGITGMRDAYMYGIISEVDFLALNVRETGSRTTTYNFIYTIRVFFFSRVRFVRSFVCLFACCWPTKNSKMLLKSQYRIEPFY